MPKARKRRPQSPKPRATTIETAPVIESVTAEIPDTAREENSIVAPLGFWSSPQWAQLFGALLWLILLGGIALRFVGLDWDANHHLHPDERFLTMTVPELRWPEGFAAWFQTAGAPHNPFTLPNMGLFVYGQFPLLLVKFVAGRLDKDSYDGILVVGRWMSALFDSGSVWFLWLIARRLLGKSWAQIAAILLAFCALNLQHAHFFVVDTFATFWIVVAFWAALKWLDAMHDSTLQVLAAQNRRYRALLWALLSGLSWGLALACKISAVLFAPILCGFWLAAVAPIFANWRARRANPNAETHRAKSPLWLSVLLLIVGAIWAFRLGHPMAFRGESTAWSLGGLLDLRPADSFNDTVQTFWRSLNEQRDITNGTRDVPWNLQWFGRANYGWPLRNLLIWGIGWQQLVPATIGAFWMSWRWLKGQHLQGEMARFSARATDAGLGLAMLWSVWVFAYHAGQFSKFSRYYLLMTPFVALLAAWCAQQLWQRARASLQVLADASDAPQVLATRLNGASIFALLFAGAMTGGSVLWGACVAGIYTRPNTRVAATQWMENLPDGTVIANESVWDDTLPLDDKSRFQMLDLKVLDRDDAAKRTALLDTLDRAQYVVISSPRLWATIPRIGPRFPLTSRYYQALFSGELGFLPIKQWTSYPTLNLFGWRIEFPDDNAEEALTVYDHPRVVLFRKTDKWSKPNAAQILDPALLDSMDEAPLMELKNRGVTVDEKALPQLPSP